MEHLDQGFHNRFAYGSPHGGGGGGGGGIE